MDLEIAKKNKELIWKKSTSFEEKINMSLKNLRTSKAALDNQIL